MVKKGPVSPPTEKDHRRYEAMMVGSVPDPEIRSKKLIKIRDSPFEVRQRDLMARYCYESIFQAYWRFNCWSHEKTHTHLAGCTFIFLRYCWPVVWCNHEVARRGEIICEKEMAWEDVLDRKLTKDLPLPDSTLQRNIPLDEDHLSMIFIQLISFYFLS